ncbi:MAG TPA: response regulator [Thermoanaerobaculia bacterium]|nr:response regulator [Thermoanaerobaculia bacterium]
MSTPENAVPILIVEDDEPTQKLLQAVLRRFGYASEVASNGQEGIDRLRDGTYSVVVLDIMMPHVGGRVVVDFLAENGRKVPVIVCSAAGPSALSGFDPEVVKGVVRKPFDVDEFIAAIRSCLTS